MPNASSPAVLRVLVVGGSVDDVALLTRQFNAQRTQTELCHIQPGALGNALASAQRDFVLLGPDLPAAAATQLIQQTLGASAGAVLLTFGATGHEAQALPLLEQGVSDFLPLDRPARFAPIFRRELETLRLRRAHAQTPHADTSDAAHFRALCANIPGVLFQLRQARPQDRICFSFASEASLMLLGMSAEHLLALESTLTDFVVPDDREGLLDLLVGTSERGGTLNWEGRILPPGGMLKWINVRCSARRLADGSRAWDGVMWNITQSKMVEAELRNSRSQLAELSGHLQIIKEEERDRIARDIHDALGGTLVGIKISQNFLATRLAAEAPGLHEAARDILDMLDEAISTAGRVARDLRPGILREFGLAAAIESYAEDYTHRAGTPCSVRCADYDLDVDEDVALALFRCYQEALTNVSKHAAAGRVEIRLMQEDDQAVLEISDDGRGLSELDLCKPKSFGLRSIRERLHGLGGRVDLIQRSPRGTTVALRAPARRPEPAGARAGSSPNPTETKSS